MDRGWFKLKGLGLNYMWHLMKGCCDNVKLGPFNWLFKGKNCDVGKKLDYYLCVLFWLALICTCLICCGLYKFVYIVATML